MEENVYYNLFDVYADYSNPWKYGVAVFSPYRRLILLLAFNFFSTPLLPFLDSFLVDLEETDSEDCGSSTTGVADGASVNLKLPLNDLPVGALVGSESSDA